jgi:hypothetical protein
VLVVDPRDRTVQLIDFQSGTATKVGRLGAGPGEYGFPGRIIALPADTSAIFDPSNARYLLITPDGKPDALFRLDEAVANSLGGRGSVPRATDARGRIFFEGSPYTSTPGVGITPVDSAPVMRYDRLTRKLDTLAYVHLEKNNVRVSDRQGTGLSITVGATAFPARDDWGPLPDGGVAIARASDYHVDRYSPSGVRTSGPPVKVDPVRVTEAEKDAWREERRAKIMPRQSKGGGTPSMPPLTDPEFPAVMPPFVWWETLARPNGELWVLRSRKAGEHAIYDVFNAVGAMIGRAALPAKTRLAGFGNGTIYVVRRDDDDLEYLQRYKLPNNR